MSRQGVQQAVTENGLAYSKLDPTRLSFLDLPEEIRKNVYDHYFSLPEGVSIHLVRHGDSRSAPVVECTQCATQDLGLSCNGQWECQICLGDEFRCDFPEIDQIDIESYLLKHSIWPFPGELPSRGQLHQISTDTHHPVFPTLKENLCLEHMGMATNTCPCYAVMPIKPGPDGTGANPSTGRWFAEHTKNEMCSDLRTVSKAVNFECRQYSHFDNTFHIVGSRMVSKAYRDGSYSNDLCGAMNIAPRFWRQMAKVKELTLTGDIAWQFKISNSTVGGPFARFHFPHRLFKAIFDSRYLSGLEQVNILARNPYEDSDKDIWASQPRENVRETCGRQLTDLGQNIDPTDATVFEAAPFTNPQQLVYLARVPKGATRTSKYTGINNGMMDGLVKTQEIVTMRAPFNLELYENVLDGNYIRGDTNVIEIGKTAEGGYWFRASNEQV